jgi:hypothetical protein
MRKIMIFFILGILILGGIGGSAFSITKTTTFSTSVDKYDMVTSTVQTSPIHRKTPTITYDDNVIELIQQLDETLYLEYLEGLISFGPRVTGTQECADSSEYIYNEFIEIGLETRYQEWEQSDLHGVNVEATLRGANTLSDEIYIICAHYDTVSSCPGADDDGSGVALVLSAAKLMSSFGFNHTVKFVVFSGEEQGLFGSYYYVQQAVENYTNIVAVLNADMIGFAPTEEDAKNIAIYEDEYSNWITEYTIDVSNRYNDILSLEVIPSGYTAASDHYYFWDAMYNAICYNEIAYNNYYHSSEDTIENMNVDYAVRVSQLIVATLAELSEITERYSPLTPEKPSGLTPGKINVEYNYTTITTDQQQDQIYYWFDWGDGTNSGWIGPYESGNTADTSHPWSKKGSYVIKVKAKDTGSHESGWSDPLPITMPYSYNKLILQFLEWLFQRLPHAFPILRHLFGY